NKTKEKDVVSEITEWAKETIPHAEEINERCEHLGICPYEINKLLVKDAKIVCAPYIYLLHPGIKNRLLDWLGVSMQNLLVIVDEAHNLPEYARDTRSIELSARTIAIAISEIQQYNNTDTHNTEILEGVKIDDFLSVLMEILYDLAEEYVRDEDGLVPPNELEARLMSKFKVTSRKLASAVKDIVTVGMIIQDLKTKELKLPRSYVHAVGSFLQFWSSLDAENYVKIVKIEPSYSLKLPNEKPQSTLDSFDNGNEDGKNEGYDEKYALDDSVCDCYTGCKINESRSPNSNVKLNPKLEAYCLDPSEATSVFLESHATLHMSGTLSPLEEYRDSIGLPKNSKLETYPSPFPRENLLTLYTPDVTTKYEDISKDDAIIPKMESYVEKICQNFERNTAVFFPSFSLMQRFLDDGIDKRIKRTLFVETRSLIQDELMEIVKNFKISGLGKSAVLFSVVGGRISEGIDFPDKELEIALIVGIPYPKPTAKQKALQYYYDLKFGKGWEYTVKAPTTRRLLQTIGRLIRNETDRGLAVILDRRATQFEAWINLRETKDPCKEIAVFFGIQ
ncbi:MAG: ATP-dependent DNA helicase, partial [Thermoplasmata archaeon]